MPTDFTEKTTNRHLSEGDLNRTSTIASSALLRIMQESDSLYYNPRDTGWVQKKIDAFKQNLRSHITLGRTNDESHWPEEYAKMLREELEYIETCIEYNDKTGNVPVEEADLSKPLKEGIDYAVQPTTRVVGHIDLSKSDSKPKRL
tara:strand:- start:4 stop:441 length:438 start_codon:yes stop_codon:yes gene_type:complete